MLPFTSDVFFALFETYNRAIWPAQVAAYGLGLAALAAAFRPGAAATRLAGAVLAAFWLWTGAIYHIGHFSSINFAAPVFGIVFIIEGLLIAWTLVLRPRLTLRFTRDGAGVAGLTLALFALFVYPALNLLAGHGWPLMPVFGVAPCPVTIFTLGLLLMLQPHPPALLMIVPVLWALVGGSAAWLLDVPEDASLPAAALIALVAAIWKRRHAAPAARIPL